jgi:prepilin-type N-terminal cleavage/methylation domain-containing protein
LPYPVLSRHADVLLIPSTQLENPMRNLRNNKGFTLIELMIVVVIIGILAAIAIPKFNAVSKNAKQAEAGPILKQICTLAATYKDQIGSDAGSVADLESKVGYTAPAAKYFSFTYGAGVATATKANDQVGTQTMTCATGVLSDPA